MRLNKEFNSNNGDRKPCQKTGHKPEKPESRELFFNNLMSVKGTDVKQI
jgi:hypothetical protein